MKSLEEITKEIAAISAQLAALAPQLERYALPSLFTAEEAAQNEEGTADPDTPAPAPTFIPKYTAKYGRKRYIQGEERLLCELFRMGAGWQDISDQMVARGFPRRTPEALARKVSELRNLTTRKN